VTTAGDADTQTGMAAHVAIVTRSMEAEYVFNADGELLVVAQENGLRFRTEFGVIDIEPGEICVIPRGVIFKVELIGGPARAYVCENYGGAFTLPDRGPDRRQLPRQPARLPHPVAAYEDKEEPSTLFVKWGGELYAPRSGSRPSTWSPGTATTRPTSTTCATSRPSARSCSTTPTRRSSRC
jgi:homogentisate 1,2-dioxygenase